MMKAAGIALVFFAPFFFPLSFSIVVVCIGTMFSPVVPLVAGLVIDALYYSGGGFPFPLFTLGGALASLVAYGVHRFIQTSIMRS